ncbi:MAG: hypothetical protein ACI9BO_002609 [Zhongshania sp.]
MVLAPPQATRLSDRANGMIYALDRRITATS